MPDSTGFGDYTETGQVIPVRFRAARAATPIACSQRRAADRRWPRALGFRKNSPTRRCMSRSINWSARSTTAGSGRHRHDGIQAQSGRRRAIRASLAAPTFCSNHPARRRQPRICESSNISRGRDAQGSLDRSRAICSRRTRSPSRRAAGARGRLRRTSRLRPHAGPRQSRLRLSPAVDEARVSAQAGHGRSVVTCVSRTKLPS